MYVCTCKKVPQWEKELEMEHGKSSRVYQHMWWGYNKIADKIGLFTAMLVDTDDNYPSFKNGIYSLPAKNFVRFLEWKPCHMW